MIFFNITVLYLTLLLILKPVYSEEYSNIVDEESQAIYFAKSANKHLSQGAYELNLAKWNYNTNMTEENKNAYVSN